MAFTEGNTNRECSFFLGWDGGLCGLWMDGREQKIGGGDVRAEASSWDGEWDKAKNDCKGTVLLQSNSTYSIHYQYFSTIFRIQKFQRKILPKSTVNTLKNS